MILVLLIGVLTLLGLSIGVWKLIERLKLESTHIERFLGVLLFLSLLLFIVVLKHHSTPFNLAIDPFVDPCYSPISYKNAGFLILSHILAVTSMIILYFKEFKLSPILISAGMIFLNIGIITNCQFLQQISQHDTSNIHLWSDGNNASLHLALYPILLIIISVGILIKLIKNKAKLNSQIKYENSWLNYINDKLVASKNLPLYAFLLTVPFLIFMLIVLILLGQDVDSFTKVYSETATWKFSEHLHPPTVDDRHGHYLCTVAAYGNPKIVKPIGVGKRNNKLIVINRQLQIANAFEYMVEKISPISHKFIRTNYDKHGINLARRISNMRLSNLTYILMKPIEWIFLILLYAYFINPEKIIKSQYKYTT